MPHLPETLESVRRQTRKASEIVVVENFSTDGTSDLLLAQRDIRVVQQPKLVPAPANWSRAAAETNGDFVKVLCADDLIDDTILERQADVLERHPEVVMVVAPRRVVSPQGRVILKRLGLSGGSRYIKGCDALRIMAHHGGNPFGEVGFVLFRGPVLRDCLPWPDTFGYTTDLAMYAKILRRGDLFSGDEVLGSFRIGHQSWSHQARSAQHLDQRKFAKSLSGQYGQRLKTFNFSLVVAKARLRQTLRQVLTTYARLLDRFASK